MKTVPTEASVEQFIASVEHAGRREDAEALLGIMRGITGAKAAMWGDSLIGYGSYEYLRADGSKHAFFVTGFSPRKANMSLYLMSGCSNHAEKLKTLGPHKHSVSCLYVGRLAKIDTEVLKDVIRDDIAAMRQMYPALTL
ncbi:MAG: DUF1801 domain-containing protein [Pseudomonadota bacterium]